MRANILIANLRLFIGAVRKFIWPLYIDMEIRYVSVMFSISDSANKLH